MAVEGTSSDDRSDIPRLLGVCVHRHLASRVGRVIATVPEDGIVVGRLDLRRSERLIRFVRHRIACSLRRGCVRSYGTDEGPALINRLRRTGGQGSLDRQRCQCPMGQNAPMHQIEMGDHVRIVEAPETIANGYASREGTCYGFTTPSVTGVQVIGQGPEDYALNVGFDDGTTAWFGRSLVEFLDVSPGMVIQIGSRRLVRATNGDWVESGD